MTPAPSTRRSTSGCVPRRRRRADTRLTAARRGWQEILREKSLQELLDADHNLMLEIKALDSDMQMLVYENYNTFITATDTIRTMKVRGGSGGGSGGLRRPFRAGTHPPPRAPQHHVDSMDDKMEQLTKDVAALADQTETVTERFAPRRSEVRDRSPRPPTLRPGPRADAKRVWLAD